MHTDSVHPAYRWKNTENAHNCSQIQHRVVIVDFIRFLPGSVCLFILYALRKLKWCCAVHQTATVQTSHSVLLDTASIYEHQEKLRETQTPIGYFMLFNNIAILIVNMNCHLKCNEII